MAAQKTLDTLLQSTQARANAQMALVNAQKALDDAIDKPGVLPAETLSGQALLMLTAQPFLAGAQEPLNILKTPRAVFQFVFSDTAIHISIR